MLCSPLAVGLLPPTSFILGLKKKRKTAIMFSALDISRHHLAVHLLCALISHGLGLARAVL